MMLDKVCFKKYLYVLYSVYHAGEGVYYGDRALHALDVQGR